MGKKTVRGHDIANRFVYSLIYIFIYILPRKTVMAEQT